MLPSPLTSDKVTKRKQLTALYVYIYKWFKFGYWKIENIDARGGFFVEFGESVPVNHGLRLN